jgi:hypothetical protein
VELRCGFENFGGQVARIEDGLRAAFAVAQVDKQHAAEVAPRMHPTGQSHSLPRVWRAQFIAMMCSFHFVIVAASR